MVYEKYILKRGFYVLHLKMFLTILFIVLGLFLLQGCNSEKGYLDATYRYKGIYGIAHVVELRSDSTFSYYWQQGLNKGVIEGIYKKDRKKIVLNGINSKPEKMVVREGNIKSKDSTYFQVMDMEGKPLPMATIVLDSIKVLETNMDGKVAYSRAIIRKKFDIYYLVFHEEYEFKNRESNQFLIQIDFHQDSEFYLEKVKGKIGKNQLILKNNPVSNDENIKLQKFKIENVE